jgi:serine/threonine-protein kinase RsbW
VQRTRFRQVAVAEPATVGALRRALVDFASENGAPADKQHDIRLAASEALTNAVMHGYAEGSPGRVVAEAWADKDTLTIAVCDEGEGMRVRQESPGAGMGLAIIEHVADAVTVEADAPGVRVTMTFALAAPAGGSA